MHSQSAKRRLLQRPCWPSTLRWTGKKWQYPVRSDYKHKGVAWELLRHAARYAEAKGVKTLESIESRENHEAIELEREQGFVAETYPDDATLMLIRKEFRRD